MFQEVASGPVEVGKTVPCWIVSPSIESSTTTLLTSPPSVLWLLLFSLLIVFLAVAPSDTKKEPLPFAVFLLKLFLLQAYCRWSLGFPPFLGHASLECSLIYFSYLAFASQQRQHCLSGLYWPIKQLYKDAFISKDHSYRFSNLDILKCIRKKRL